jgi:hypothetical protein
VQLCLAHDSCPRHLVTECCRTSGYAICTLFRGAQGAGLKWPLKDPIVNQDYACYDCLINDPDPGYHVGLDLKSSATTDLELRCEGSKTQLRCVFAVASGVVKIIRNDNIEKTNANHCMGNIVIIDHGNRTHSLYAHLDEIDPVLGNGQTVKAGDPIGTYGIPGKRGRGNVRIFQNIFTSN